MDWIYDKTNDNSARFTLGIPGNSVMLCFGINPSTAEPDNLDNTLKSVERIAKRHNFDGWVMFNVYPQRATNPDDMHAEMDTVLHRRNLEAIESILQTYKGKAKKVLAAWGTLINKRDYLKTCLRDIHAVFKKYDCEWVSIGKESKKGHPHHPLYLSNEERLKPFDMATYIELI